MSDRDEGFAGLPERLQPTTGRMKRHGPGTAEYEIERLEAENAALRAERDQWKFGRMADHTGHMFRCAKVNGKWTCAKDCAMARLTALEEALSALEQRMKDGATCGNNDAVWADELAALRARLAGAPCWSEATLEREGFTEEQIRAAFWDVFHESGEWWFGGERGDRDDNQRRTGIYWEQFLAALRAGLTQEE